MKTVMSLTLAVGLSLLGFTATATILPPNDLHLEDNLFTEDANMTEEDFVGIIDGVVAAYNDIVSAHDADLNVNKLWTNSTVNANASQSGRTWNVNMYGGLARRPEVTPDGFAMVVCHELGHHLAGFPFYGSDWAASEGESDYFATQACARRIWGQQLEKNAASTETVHPIAKTRCDAAWTSEADRNLCYRTAMAGQSLAKLLAALGGTAADFETPNTAEIGSTKTSHPDGQCRLDTYFNGALCNAELDPAVIPGRRHADGQGSLAAETIAAKYSCTRAAFSPDGMRPLCWFKPKLKSLLTIKEITATELSGNGNGALEPNESASIIVKIENLANRAYDNITAVISSLDGKFEVLRGEASYDTIAAKTSKAGDSPFEIKVGDLTCGEEFAVDIKLNLGEGKEAKFAHTIQVGRLVETDLQSMEVGQDIPDKAPAGIDSMITVAQAGTFAKLKVTVDITHTYRGDLIVKLTSPTGQEFVLHSRKGGTADDLKQTFEVDLPVGLEVTGDWTLNTADIATRDTGKLNSWGMQFTKAVCE